MQADGQRYAQKQESQPPDIYKYRANDDGAPKHGYGGDFHSFGNDFIFLEIADVRAEFGMIQQPGMPSVGTF